MKRAERRYDAMVLVNTLRLTSSQGWHQRLSWQGCTGMEVVRLAKREGAALWLHRRLSNTGVLLDSPSRTALSGLVKDGLAHCLRVDAEVAATGKHLDAAGIPFVLLKGAAMRAIADRVPFADARAPGDVDILCREEDAKRAWDVLTAAGYTSPKAGPPDEHHLPALVGPAGVGVDIHVTTVPQVSPAEAWRRATTDARTIMYAGQLRVVPSDTELLWHSLSHMLATIDEVARACLRLKRWLDAAALIASDAIIDWDVVRQRIASPECTHPALARAWVRVAFELAGRKPLGDWSVDTPPMDLVRLLAWRLQFTSSSETLWEQKLLEEGTRGEAGLALQPGDARRSFLVRARHLSASSMSRWYWQFRTRMPVKRA